MKKLLLVAIAIVSFTFAKAQTFGAKAGLNLANVNYSGGDLENQKSLTAFQIGAVAEFEISDKFSFQPELVYSMQGVAYEIDVLGTKADVKDKTSYLNIPLMAKYYVSDNVSVQLGPQIGFLMAATSEVGDSSADMKDDTSSIDFGLNFGLGYKMDSGLFFDARYNLGFSDIVKDRASGDDSTAKNAVINFTVGYTFGK